MDEKFVLSLSETFTLAISRASIFTIKRVSQVHPHSFEVRFHSTKCQKLNTHEEKSLVKLT